MNDNMSLDWRDIIPTDEDIQKMRVRGEGYKEIARRWYRIRISMGMALIFERLDIVPPVKLQAELTHVMMESLWAVPDDVVLAWARDAANWMNRQEDGGGHA